MLDVFDTRLRPETGREEEERIATGSLVRLRELGEGGEWEVTIVSSGPADPEADCISDVCPIGEALLGRRAGDVVLVEVPLGTVRYRVVSVSRAPHTVGNGREGQPEARSRFDWEDQ